MEWFRNVSSKIVDTQLGPLSLDTAIARKDYPMMFICTNGNLKYYAFWEVEHTAYYEQWYVTPIPKWLRDKVHEHGNGVCQIWHWDERHDLSTDGPKFYYMRHWLETDMVDVWETEDGAPEEVYDSAYDY